MDEFRTFIDEVKDRAELLREIEETGAEYAFERRQGKYAKSKIGGGLVVDTHLQQYTWFAHAGRDKNGNETGDVFDWLQRYRHMDFWDAALYLAQRYGIRVPELKHSEPSETAKAYQARGELFTLVHEWLMKQLWSTPAALDYCRRADGGRAWADETICHKVTAAEALAPGAPYQLAAATMAKAQGVAAETAATTIVARGAGLGYCPGTSQSAEDLKAWLEMNGAELKAPAAVAITGLQGGVAAWCRDHAIEAQSNWLEKNRIHGLVEKPRLIYVHFGRGGKAVYFSARNMKWEGEGRLIGEPDKSWKSYNPPEALVGRRMPYFNWLFHKKADEVVIVEGQADAITLGEWGIPALGLNGLTAGPEVAAIVKEIRKRFLALDQDQAGQAAMLQVAQAFGPKVRIVQWAVPLQFAEVDDGED